MTGTSHENQYTFLIIARSVLRMKNVADKVKKLEVYILYSITVLENRAVYDIMWENLV
jgi:hypothetical protein